MDAFQEALRTDPDQKDKSKYILLFKAPDPVAEMILLAGKAALLRRAYQGIVPEEQVSAMCGGGVSRGLRACDITVPMQGQHQIRPTLHFMSKTTAEDLR